MAKLSVVWYGAIFVFLQKPKSVSGRGSKCRLNQTEKTQRVNPSFQIASLAQQVPGLKHFPIQGIN